MKEHIYKATCWQIIQQSVFVWAFLAVTIYSTLTLLSNGPDTELIWTLFFIAFLWAISIAGMSIHIDYLRHTLNKDFIVSINSLEIVDRKSKLSTRILHSDIQRIELHNTMHALVPWSLHEYFSVIDTNGKTIIVTSYIMDIIKFRLDTFGQRLSRKEFDRFNRYLPVIRKRKV